METAPGVSVQQVLDATDAELAVPDTVTEMPIERNGRPEFTT
jgi:acyl CoA:acetate/3-ketoacid CoA transferase beta subunit